MVQLQADDDVYLKSSTDYDNLCKKYGLRGYNTATSNNNCPDIGGTGPTITNNCNIGSMLVPIPRSESIVSVSTIRFGPPSAAREGRVHP